MSKPTVIVYGATAFSARELVNYLDNHPDADQFNVILAGRNKAKLEGVANKLQKKHEIVACQLTDEEGVKKLVERGNVVINLAGPYRWHNAEALIRECAATGKHYVDLAGESHWLATDIIPNYDYLATKTGACIVPSCGFDSVPSDITVYSALHALQAEYPSASITNSISYFKVKGSISGGTIESMRSVAEIPKPKRGEWVLVGRGGGPSPPPKLLYQDDHPSVDRPLIGAFFFMYPFNRTIVRRSWYLSRLNDQISTPSRDEGGKDEPIHGSDFVYQEAMELGSRVKVLITTCILIVFGILFFGSSITRWLLGFVLPKAGSGASEKSLAKGWFKVTNISKTTQKDVEVITVCEGKGDPGYISTTYMLSESALSLILPPPPGTQLPHLGKQGGVLTPSTAFGQVIIERLKKSGKVTWKSEIVESKKTK